MIDQEKITVLDHEDVPPEHQAHVDPVSLGEIAVRSINCIADPIGFMRKSNPQKAREMQQRRDELVRQRELSLADDRLRDFRIL